MPRRCGISCRPSSPGSFNARISTAGTEPTVEPASGDITKSGGPQAERAAVLNDRTKSFDFLLTESAIRWKLANRPSWRRSSIARFAVTAANIRIGVLPLSTMVRDGAFHKPLRHVDGRLVTIEQVGKSRTDATDGCGREIKSRQFRSLFQWGKVLASNDLEIIAIEVRRSATSAAYQKHPHVHEPNDGRVS